MPTDRGDGAPVAVSSVVVVPTRHGEAHVHLDRPDQARLLLLLTHGAGGGVNTPDLVAVRDALLPRGVVVGRVEQAYRVAARRSPAPIAQLDEAWTDVTTAVRADPELADLPFAVGGRSNGARVACRTARGTGARAVVALAFPLHPPGRPERSRRSELTGAGVPVLVVQGERDAFGRPYEFPRGTVLAAVPGDHALRRGADRVGRAVALWLAAQRLA